MDYVTMCKPPFSALPKLLPNYDANDLFSHATKWPYPHSARQLRRNGTMNLQGRNKLKFRNTQEKCPDMQATWCHA
eukprot:584443-Amphidinium_carterae.1